ncbi:MAG: helix-turn-helix domain-containing protein [Sedimentisphaerales bacterium]|nr:helix-turn-helix domain-containing protein [Sedimentisphaerales bacterium]NLT76995.1 helix-turn-helix domain-containing protein [Planctomycetota bacterium]
MAGMFYSLKETAEKLGMTEDEVKQLAEDGKLREFRDGSNLLFKIEEVNALQEEAPDMDMDLGLEPEEGGASTQELLGLEPVAEDVADQEPSFGLEEEEAPALEEVSDMELSADADATSALDLSGELTDEEEPAEVSAEDEDFMIGLADEEEPAAGLIDKESEISLAPESGILDSESDITDMDTALTGEGLNVLGESDADYDVTDDSLAETVGPAGTSTEASLEEIEDDVNLDSFGSGSGLLDLSLQADDTSLGGILDEIYTTEGGEEGATGEEGDMVGDMAAEAEHAVADIEMAAPEPMIAAPAAIAQAFVEVAPDAQSNMLGILLFLPLAALLYAAIVVVAAHREVMPSILESIQGVVWYILAGATVVSILVIGASFVVGGEKKPKATKAPKAKKEKKAKDKKAAKEKPAKAEKPKKEKKPLFGKKKG